MGLPPAPAHQNTWMGILYCGVLHSPLWPAETPEGLKSTSTASPQESGRSKNGG